MGGKAHFKNKQFNLSSWR